MLDFAEYAVKRALKLGASYAEARVETSTKEVLITKNGKSEIPTYSKESGIAIRLIKKGMSFVSTNKFDKREIDKLLKKAVKLAKLSPEVKLSDEKTVKAKDVIKGKDVDIKKKEEYLKSLDKSISSIKEIKSRMFWLISSRREKYFVNSEGTTIFSSIPRYMLEYNLIALSSGKIEQRYFSMGGSGGWKIVDKWKAEKKLLSEAKALSNLLKAKSLKPGKMDVILSPELIGIIVHESCGHPFEADRILGREAAQAGESYIKPSWVGRKIGSEEVTIAEDPTIKGSYGYYKYDDEGVKARRRILIKNGYVNEFLHNRETAYYFGVRSNGSARASSFSREPIVRMSNTFMLPGDYSLEELIEDIKHGIYIKSFTEWNIDDTRWNEKYVGSESYLIVNGKISGMVRRPVLEITTPKLYSSVDARAKDLDFVTGTCGKGDPMQGVPVWMGGPHVRLRKVYIKGG